MITLIEIPYDALLDAAFLGDETLGRWAFDRVVVEDDVAVEVLS
jgi:hypothetical protein